MIQSCIATLFITVTTPGSNLISTDLMAFLPCLLLLKKKKKKDCVWYFQDETQHFLLCSLQYFADIDEANSWLQERQTLVASKDYGKDESSAEALLHRHLRLEKEIAAYSTEMRRLKEQAAIAAEQAPAAVSSLGIVSVFVPLFCKYWSWLEISHRIFSNGKTVFQCYLNFFSVGQQFQ